MHSHLSKTDLIRNINKQYTQLLTYVEGFSKEDFLYKPSPEKWNAAQQAAHLLSSIKPLLLAFSLPTFVLKIMFGKAQNPSKSESEIIKQYQAKLSEGAKASKEYIPKEVSWEERSDLIANLHNTLEKLQKKINHYSESQLDACLLPHPVLGKITLREMLYFTRYHAEHHQKSIENLFEK
ncbi:MAG: DinB family protein [Cytophagales bacterium]|nr:MAG: DinB family protein [Cytophagales bacterium]